jgi:hypothetical protein
MAGGDIARVIAIAAAGCSLCATGLLAGAAMTAGVDAADPGAAALATAGLVAGVAVGGGVGAASA